jgi:hypothetical protein
MYEECAERGYNITESNKWRDAWYRAEEVMKQRGLTPRL